MQIRGKYKCVAYKDIRLVGYLYAGLVLKLTKTDINGHYNVVQLAYIMKTDFVGIIIRHLGSTHESFFVFFYDNGIAWGPNEDTILEVPDFL